MTLKLEKVSHRYKDQEALKSIDCELSPGIYGLLGPNGAGKSTLLRILVDVLVPTNGRVLYNNRAITALGASYREQLGYLPQEFHGYSQFTAEEFLKYVANLKGLDAKTARVRVKHVLALVGLTSASRKKLKGYSGGMRRRVGIAQALLNNPKVLILDEPTAGLDPSERIRLRGILSQLAQDTIIILSTHIVSDIEYVADEVLLLKEGQLIEKASPRELLAKLDRQVWTVQVQHDELSTYTTSYPISNLQLQEEYVDIRIVSQAKPHDAAQPTKPRMEDLYVYYFGSGDTSSS
ncbi:ABC transporter ATP-binding protein [Sporosarcina sp. BI001-red]|uniref:ABC transporter ATP-binding protein n=1 Tax=Sporosarcina sp. BI001-red TaxID=2282866 RepID=UPI000E23102B|nr:ABC transporter ATP-binding protein [Sporosarcina sp. BI001-red]REB06632.1 ABC transporter ATP-binding protein [Sporosarcina sp. BI001-red]